MPPQEDIAPKRENAVEFTQKPMSRYGNVDAAFRDPSGKRVEDDRGAPLRTPMKGGPTYKSST
jgi:hypothetical protein